VRRQRVWHHHVVAVPTVVAGLAAVRMASVSAGGYHTLALSYQGIVYSFGCSDGPAWSRGDDEDQQTPRAIEALQGVRAGAVSAGDRHSLVLGIDGLVYWFGYGTHGQLEALRGVQAIAVSTGHEHSLVLGRGGEVYSFGAGYLGKLGHGNNQCQYPPQVIEALKGVRVRAVAAGGGHSLVVSVGGDAYSFGLGAEGQLGHGNDINQLLPKRIEAIANVRAVAAGGNHSMRLTEAGLVYSFGCGGAGRLGHNNTDDQPEPRIIEALRGVKVSAIAAGYHTSLAVAAGGAAYGWGSGEDARLGLGLTDHQLTVTPLQYPTAQLRLQE